MKRTALVLPLLLAGCGSSAPARVSDAGTDAGSVDAARTDAYLAPPDAYFGDTNAADSGACATFPTFDELSASVFVPRCGAPACHDSLNPGEHGGIAFDLPTARARMVGGLSTFTTGGYLVIPGDVGHSFLWRKLTNDIAIDGSEGTPMPQADPWLELAPSELEQVRCWIAGGAL